MTHTKDRLLAASARLAAFAASARAAGRGEDAALLAVASDVCGEAAAKFATVWSVVSEDGASATEVRRSGFFGGCQPVEGYTLDAACCLFTHEGICRGCSFARVQWTYNNKRYTCLTRFSVHNGTGRLLDDEHPA